MTMCNPLQGCNSNGSGSRNCYCICLANIIVEMKRHVFNQGGEDNRLIVNNNR